MKRNPSLQPKSGNHALRGVSPDVQGNNGGKDHTVKPRAEQKAEKGCQRNAIGGYPPQDHERPKRKATSRIMEQGGETSDGNGGGVTPAMRG